MNEKTIKESENEKYVGDYMTDKANPKAKILDRKQKRNGIPSKTSLLRRQQAQTLPNEAPPIGKIHPFS